jgi:TonB family protein
MTVYDQDRPEARRVFLSYSSIDRVRTSGLGLLLEAMGHQVFHDHRTIKPGQKWESALQEGLDEADAVMVFWTRHASRSDWVRKEYEYFYTTYPDRLLVPVLGDETPLTDILKTRQHADFAPVVNEVLETKRKMKKEGASAGEIERAVTQRLDDAGVEIKTKKQRRMLSLFLGFGWLLALLRHPGATAEKLGRGTVEKTAQLTAGQIAAIGAATMIGLAAVPAAERIADLGATSSDTELTTMEAASGVDEPGGSEASGADLGASGGEESGGSAAGESDRDRNLAAFGTSLLQTQEAIKLRLTAIENRLSALELGEAVAIAECRQEVAVLRDDLRTLEAAYAGGGGGAGGGQVTEPTPLPVVTVRPVINEGQEIVFVASEVTGELVDPVPISTPRPEYPDRARDIRLEGIVTVLADIDEQGNVSVEDADGPTILADAAIDAVNTWTFKPGTRNGEPMSRKFNVRVVFAFRER